MERIYTGASAEIETNVLHRNNVRTFGKGTQSMIFAHGFGCDQNMWRFITPAFSDNYKIILFDYVGAGKSDLSAYSSKRYSTLDGYAQDVIDVLHALGEKNVIFVGHSVSSMIGLLAGVKEPQLFSKMIFVGPSPRYINEPGYKGGFNKEDLDSLFETMDSNYLGWAQSIAPAIMGRPDAPEYGEELTNSFCATNPDIAREFAKVTFYSDNRKDLHKLKVPVLSLQCSNDIIAPVEVGKYLDEHIPDHTLYMMEASGHCPHISAPEETIQAMKEFLK